MTITVYSESDGDKIMNDLKNKKKDEIKELALKLFVKRFDGSGPTTTMRHALRHAELALDEISRKQDEK